MFQSCSAQVLGLGSRLELDNEYRTRYFQILFCVSPRPRFAVSVIQCDQDTIIKFPSYFAQDRGLGLGLGLGLRFRIRG